MAIPMKKLIMPDKNGVEQEFEVIDELMRNTFVTPEMFGAIGNGDADDTAAWQKAVNTGLPVKATKKRYKCGQINVTQNIEIDCNDAEFICTEDILFNCKGEIITTLQNEADYSANQSNYSITDETYADYTGFAMLKGTNNFEKSRSYYKGGFVCEFYNGKIACPYPVDATNVTIDLIVPITVYISNVKNITHVSPNNNSYGIIIFYGYNCKLENINTNESSGYECICFRSCIGCILTRSHLVHNYGTNGTNSYSVAVLDSSFCAIVDSYISNNYWHAISTGGSYLCYHNVIDNCEIIAINVANSYEDHENARNSIITNSIVTGSIGITALGHIDNVTIMPYVNPSNRVYAKISVYMSSDKRFARYDISNVKIMSNAMAKSKWVGIWIGTQTEVSSLDNTYYLNRLNIRNVKDYNLTYFGEINVEHMGVNNSYSLGEIHIDDTNLDIKLGLPNSVAQVTNIDNYDIHICNIKSRYINFDGSSNYKYRKLSITNSCIGLMIGTFKMVELFSVNISKALNPSNISVTDMLIGSNILGCIYTTLMSATTVVNITDIYNNVDSVQNYKKCIYNVYKSNSENLHYQYWSNGSLVTA